jgi:hypothetical protein
MRDGAPMPSLDIGHEWFPKNRVATANFSSDAEYEAG